MAIPELSQENINKALQYIDENGVPPGYGSKAYDLIVNGKKYPPKYVVAVARHLKDGAAIDTSDYNGVEAKNYFKARGFEIFVKKEILPETNYWLAGTFFNKKDMIDDFVADSYWEGGQVNSSAIMSSIKSVKKGDVLIAKSTTTKGPNHSIPLLKVKAVGLVMSDMRQMEVPDWYKCDVEWIKLPEYKDYEGAAYGKYQGTMHLCKEQDLITFAKKVLDVPIEDYSSYVNLLKANHNIILHGAPGTGKTYLAKKIAEAMECSENEIGFVQFHQSYDYTDFVEGLRPVEDENGKVEFERKDGVFKEFCIKAITNIKNSEKTIEQIEREKSVEDEIESFLSNAIDGKIEFQIATGNKFYISGANQKYISISIPENEKANTLALQRSNLLALLNSDKKIDSGADILDFFHRKWRAQHDSYFLAIYKEIQKEMKEPARHFVTEVSKRKDYVFIIDEINRGEMSKIFGELFFSIDPGYRGKKGMIRTQYANLQNDPNEFDRILNIADENNFGYFFVPENVYIIGTMNDIDRSVESMDFAMRRRFAFKEIKADDRVEMLDSLECGKKKEAVKCMQALNKEIEGISGLSPAYHIGPAYFLKLDNYNGDFEDLWKYHIEGVLHEYLRGMPKAAEYLAKLKDSYDKSVAPEEKVSSDDVSDSAEKL